MKIVCRVLAVGASLISGVILADPSVVPTERAFEQVIENRAKNPDNRGLENATDRIFTNQQRQAEHRANHGKGTHSREQTAERRSDAVQVSDRLEKGERVERAERPERPDRPERPERVAHGHNH